MVIVVERAFEAFFHVDHPGETSRLKRLAGIARANAAAADEEDRAGHVADQQMFDLVGEVRVDLVDRIQETYGTSKDEAEAQIKRFEERNKD